MIPPWLVPARSIPVWVCCLVRFQYVSDGAWEHGVVEGRRANGLLVRHVLDLERLHLQEHRDKDLAPDLSIPDIFAAARDRLAVAMGAPPDHVAAGVKFYFGDVGGLRVWIDAGASFPDDWQREPRMIPWVKAIDIPAWGKVERPSRELALALAWQNVVGSVADRTSEAG